MGLVEFKREFPGGPIVEADTTPGNTGQVHGLTDHGYNMAWRMRLEPDARMGIDERVKT
jgi:hypothetical protein